MALNFEPDWVTIISSSRTSTCSEGMRYRLSNPPPDRAGIQPAIGSGVPGAVRGLSTNPKYGHYAHAPMADPTRGQRLRVTLTPLDLRNVDDWRLRQRMPSRAAALRALLKLGLAEGVDITVPGFRSRDFTVPNGTDQ
jgi:hypothetical protein